MATNAPIQFQFGNLPNGYTPGTYADFWLKMQGLMTGYLPGNYTVWNVSNATPDPEDQDKPWLRLDANGRVIRAYTFYNGLWCSKHQIPPSDDERKIWVGSLNDLKTYDEGVDEAVTDVTGPFWEQDTNFNAKFMLGAGTLPDSSTVVGVTDTGGNEEITIDADSVPHKHGVGQADHASDDVTLFYETNQIPITAPQEGHFVQGGGSAIGGPITNLFSNIVTNNQRSDATVGDAVDIMPPYYGIYVIKRTAREYYTVST